MSPESGMRMTVVSQSHRLECLAVLRMNTFYLHATAWMNHTALAQHRGSLQDSVGRGQRGKTTPQVGIVLPLGEQWLDGLLTPGAAASMLFLELDANYMSVSNL